MNIESLVTAKANPKIPQIAPGDMVKVSAKIVEAGRERIQIFNGVVIRVKRSGNGASFTVRHVAQGIGVERTFPFHSRFVEKVEIVRHGKVRRAKLYYLRGLSGKEARRKVKRVDFVKKAKLEPVTADILEEEQELEAEATAMEQETELVSAEEHPKDEAAAEPETELAGAEEPPAVEAPIEPEQAPEAEAATLVQDEETVDNEAVAEEEQDKEKES